MRGRKRKPAGLQELHGDTRKRGQRRARAAVAADRRVGAASARDIPEPVRLNPDALAEWKRLTDVLLPARVISVADRGALAVVCTLYADWIRAEREIRKAGTIRKDKNGAQRRNAWLLARNKALELYLKYATEFGMTPASRPRATMSPAIALPPSKTKPADAGEMSYAEHRASRPFGPAPNLNEHRDNNPDQPDPAVSWNEHVATRPTREFN